ncbi:MAG: hypothetical protein M3R21_08855 [Candidatus Dormibacteraeota bacterium]|nr:hypothetical protein [Candidatus Dormibacteraeota bacterium]
MSSVARNYAVPAGGVITSWSTLAGPDTGPVGLQVWRQVGISTYSLVGSTVPVTLTAGTLSSPLLNGPFPASIAVQANDVLGMRLEGAATCGHSTGASGDQYGFVTHTGTTETFNLVSQFTLDVSVTLDTSVVTPPPSEDGCNSTGQTMSNDNCKQ